MDSILDPTVVLALVTGIGVAAATGLRAFLPLLALGLAGRAGWIELKPEVHWLASNPALICFGVATFVEVLADKIPIVDHALDVIATFLRPLAATLGVYAVLAHWPTPWAQIAAIVLGVGALSLHAIKAKLRIGSTAVTLGHANPLLSVAEDLAAICVLLAAILLPLVGLVLVVALIVMFVARRRAPRPPAPVADPAARTR